MTLPRTLLVVLAAALLTACPAQNPRQQFAERVVPLLERRCLNAACHGVLPDAEEKGETIEWKHFHVRVRPDGTVADLDQAYENVKGRINTAERPELSSLLRKPLAAEAGGVPHLGGAVFASRKDPAWEQLRAWVAEESGGAEGAPLEALDERQRFFADNVLPQLSGRQCMNAGCHDRFAPFTAFEPPMVLDGAPVFATEAVRKNYAAARMHLNLGGDLRLSRLLRKGLPLDRGGMVHRAGNDIFFARSPGDVMNDSAVRAILEWGRREQQAALGEAPSLLGVVFVRGPVGPQAPFEHDQFIPGTDLWVLDAPFSGAAARNLTAAVHPQPVDIREPAVSHDGRRVAFAMRRSLEDSHNIYLIDVDGEGFTQLTFDRGVLPGGGRAANVQPTFGPDGRVYFASTRAGHLADGQSFLDTELWAVDPSSGALERMTFDPAPEVTPTWFGAGKSYGSLAFTMLRTVNGRYEAPVLRRVLDHNKSYHGDPETHIHHGVTVPEEIIYGMRATADARFSTVLLERTNLWRAGRPALFERQFGPELPYGSEREASAGAFRHACSPLDALATPAGNSAGGAYRHLAPLPDGRLLASFAPGPLDLSSPTASPRFALYLLEVEDDRRTAAPRLARKVVLFEDPAASVFDAEPIVARPLEDDPEHLPAWDPTRAVRTGRLVMRHAETLEALMSNLEQRGAKTLRKDLAYLRLIEAVPRAPGEPGRLGLGERGRERILAEIPLEGGSVNAVVPAEVPLRTQFLDSRRMAVGAQHNRWFHVDPGEAFPGGVAPDIYPVTCAGCHGSLSGRATDFHAPVPDVITAASVTLATHERQNPRRPKPAFQATGAPIELDYRRDVAPLLARACTRCHAGAAAPGGLDLEARPTADFDSAYEALLAKGDGSGGGRRYVDEKDASAFGSHLIERVLGQELGAPKALTPGCAADRLTPDEQLLLIRWVDVGAPYRGAAP